MHRSLKQTPIVLALALILGTVLAGLVFAQVAQTAPSDLTVDIIAGYNLVVDSNVSSPSTYAPRTATVIGKFCNNSTTDMTDVYGYIGDYGANTPGSYPVHDPAGESEFSYLSEGGGTYAFRHIGGSNDAARYIGTISAGECKYQYWSFEYPACENVAGAWAEPACTNDPLWGTSVKPDDDFWLDFDIWTTGKEAGSARADNATWRMTMRNEISAMANKIQPNPDGLWFNTDTSTIAVGSVITTNGVNYELGNIRHGFDNDGDLAPDFNAWLQPISQPTYDPSCFRLIRTSGELTVSRSGGKPDMVIPFTDNLYFTNLPEDNTGVEGLVYYTFLALDGPCNVALSPYQEVASGFDNEKFNGDYGSGIPPVVSLEPEFTIDKTSSPNSIATGGTTTYRMPFANTGNDSLGLTLSSGFSVVMPLTIRDTVPVGMEYVCGSATYQLDVPGNNGVNIRYSVDGGNTWTSSEPASCPTNPMSSAGNEIMLEWWLNDPLPAKTNPTNTSSGYAEFKSRIPNAYVGSSLIVNEACAGLGDAEAFACTDTITLVQGNSSIGDFVWRDVNSDGLQTGESANGIDGVTISLYFDMNGDGKLDDDDVLIASQETAGGGAYDFTQLPNGNFLVVVDALDAEIPDGYTSTTPATHAVTLSGVTDYNRADFGFGPIFEVNKYLTSDNPAYKGELVTFNIDLINTLPGDGTASGFCQHTVWASVQPATDGTPASGTGNAAWQSPGSLLGRPDNSYAYTILSNNADYAGVSGFNLGAQAGNITSVKLVVHALELENLQASTAEYLRLEVYRNNAVHQTLPDFTGLGYFASGGTGDKYIIEAPLAAPTGGWHWSDFQNNVTELGILASGTGGPEVRGDLAVDAIAFVITTNEMCGGAATTIAKLPLNDTFDADLLEFQYAMPPVSSATTTGTAPNTDGVLTWDNLGPLYAGGTRRVAVTFKALAPTASTVNTASVTDAVFGNGRNVNDDSDNATVGINESGSIAGTIWADSSGDGWVGTTGFNTGDAFFPQVKVDLYACLGDASGALLLPADVSTAKTCAANGGAWTLIASETTNSSGAYLFDTLRDGYYNVKVDTTTLPVGYRTNAAETNPAGNGDGSTCGTCDNQWNLDAAVLSTFNGINNAIASENITDVSFGYVSDNGDGLIIGYVWHDVNSDGVWDAGEMPIANVDIFICSNVSVLCDSSNAIATLTTDETGLYNSVQAPGDYRVGVDTADLPGMSQSGDPDETGTCATCDSNVTTALTLVADGVAGPYNFGYTSSLGLSGTVFTDWNGSGGNPEMGEEGIEDVPVALYLDENGDGMFDPASDTYLDSTVTANDGTYSFTNLVGNGLKYLVMVNGSAIPVGLAQTADYDVVGSACSGATCDNDASVTLNATSVANVDFGYQPRGFGSIGDTVWADGDSDGMFDADENGIGDVTVNLYEDANGNGSIDTEDALVATQSTVDGIYTFTDLVAGNYIVQVPDSNFDETTDALYSLTQTNGTQDNLHAVTLGETEEYLAADFGYANGIIGDYIWVDANGDGNQDQSESGIAGVVVNLYINGNPTVYASATTDANGYYAFTSLPPNNYVVVVDTNTLPAGYTQTGDPDLTSPCVGGECDSESELTLSAGQIDRSRDFGYIPPGVLGDTLWIDADGDGEVDAGEPPVPYVTVNLYNSADCSGSPIATTETDSDGKYSFGEIPDGTYCVEVDSADPDYTALGIAPSTDADGSLDNQTTAIIAGGSVTTMGGSVCNGCDFDADFGYELAGTNAISGHVFFDASNTADNNDVYDDGTDTAYANITVYLVNGGGQLLGITKTDANGAFAFNNLPDGNYHVVVNDKSPLLSGLDLTATPNTNISGGLKNYSGLISLSGSSSITGQDFGFYANLDFGDLPDGYNTLLSSEGPSHDIGALRLGTEVDAEGEGQPELEAGLSTGGDDGDGTNDDDGVTRSSPDLQWTGGATVELNVTVTGGSGRMVGWFDWDNDGSFDKMVDWGVQAEGATTLDLVLPSAYTAGTSINARFRIFEPANIPGGTLDFGDYIGAAINGEVEDYYWPFADPNAVKQMTVQGHGLSLALVSIAALGLLVSGVTAMLWLRKRQK